LEKILKIIFIIIIFTLSFANSSANYFVQNKGQYEGGVLFLAELKSLKIAIKPDGIYFDQRGKDKGFVTLMQITGADYSFPEISYETEGRINFLRGDDKSKWVTGLRPISEIIFRDIFENISLRFYFEENNLRYDFILSPNADPSLISINFPESSPKISEDSTLVLENPIGKLEHKDLKVFYKNNKTIIKSSFKIKNNQIKFNLSNYDKNETLIIDPLIYSTIIGGSDYDKGIELDINSNEEIAVIGKTKSINFPTSPGVYQDTLSRENFDDIFVVKYDKFFNWKFITYIGGSDNEIASSVQILDDGSIVGFGSSKSSDFPVAGNPLFSDLIGGYDLVFFKLSENGNLLRWSSYFGSETDDLSSKLKVFKNSDFYISANINEAGSGDRIPTTSGMLTNSSAGNYAGKIDGYVAKILSDGSQILWATVIGGLNDDFIHDMELDSSGNVFICGETRSVNYPTSEYALDRSYNDNQNDLNVSDAFFSKISSDGDSLKYSSLIGGTRTDKAYGIAVDESDNIYLGGSTSSFGFPTSEEAYARELNNGSILNKLPDIFCAKIYTGGFSKMELVYSTYIGGEASERARGIDIDSKGNAYLTGSTNSANLETTELAFDSDLNDTSGTSDIFVIKLSPNGDELKYSSYFGGMSGDNGLDIKVKGENNVFVTGESSSTYFPVSKDAFQASHQDNGKTDAIFFNLFLETPQDADYTICKGDWVKLDSRISSEGDDNLIFLWSPSDYLDDPNAEFPIATPPKSIQYSCLVTLEDDFTDVVEIVVSVVPDVNAQIFGKTEVQNGKIFTYSAPNHFGSTYSWTIDGGEILSGDGSYFVAVKWSDADNGALRLEETNSWGCKGYASLFTRFVTDWVIKKIPYGNFSICEGDTIVMDGGSQYYNFLWNDGTVTQLDTIWEAGDYWFGAKSLDGSDFNSDIIEVDFLEKPIPPIIEFIEETKALQCYSISTFYQWFRNGVPIPNATGRRLIVSEDGDYYLEITSENGCKNVSETITVIITSVKNNAEFSYLLFPNPAQDNFNIISSNPNNKIPKLINIEIFDNFGKLQKELI
jgi:Beta-propeller repeat